MEKEGRLIEPVDPKPAIKKHQETAEWVYRDESKFWNQVAEKMEERFFNLWLGKAATPGLPPANSISQRISFSSRTNDNVSIEFIAG
jgi:hypothetical protein